MPASRVLRVAALLAVLLAGGSPAGNSGPAQDPPARSEQPPVRSQATFVRVDVYPMRDGRPVNDLTAADFELLEDGVRQEIRTFEHVLVPIDPGADVADPGSLREMLTAARNPRARVVVVFLDPAHVSLAGSHAIREPLGKLINRVLGPDDLVGLMTPDMSASQVVLGRKSLVVEEMLRRNWDWGQASDNIPRLNERENMYTMCYPPGPNEGAISRLARQMIAKSRERRTLEAMQDLVRYLGAIREERKAVVTVSQGWRLQGTSPEMMNLRKDTEPVGREPITVGPRGQPALGDRRNMVGISKSECDGDRMRLAQMDNRRFFRDLLDDSNRANTSFYPLDPGGLRAAAGGGSLNGDSAGHLRELAENTDGLAMVNTNDLDKSVQRIVEDLTSYYLLGYNSTNASLDGRYRQIRVRVKRPGIQVRARRGYRAATPAELSAPARSPAGSTASPVAEAMGPLARIRPDARFRVNAAYLAEGDQLRIWIAGEIPASAGSTDEFSAGAVASIEVQTGERSTTARVLLEPGERGFVTAVTLRAADQVDVRATLTGEGSASPVLDTFHFETDVARPLVFRRGPSTGNRVVPTADLRFTRAERITVRLPVTGAVRPGTARLLDRRGQPLRLPMMVGEQVEDDGQRWITGELTLAPLAAGDYVIEQAPDGMQKVMTAIRVTR